MLLSLNVLQDVGVHENRNGDRKLKYKVRLLFHLSLYSPAANHPFNHTWDDGESQADASCARW